MIQFLRMDDSQVREYLCSSVAEFISPIRACGYSHLSHVQYAVRRLFELLQDRKWIDHLVSEYIRGSTLHETPLLIDLLDYDPNNGEGGDQSFGRRKESPATVNLRRSVGRWQEKSKIEGGASGDSKSFSSNTTSPNSASSKGGSGGNANGGSSRTGKEAPLLPTLVEEWFVNLLLKLAKTSRKYLIAYMKRKHQEQLDKSLDQHGFGGSIRKDVNVHEVDMSLGDQDITDCFKDVMDNVFPLLDFLTESYKSFFQVISSGCKGGIDMVSNGYSASPFAINMIARIQSKVTYLLHHLKFIQAVSSSGTTASGSASSSRRNESLGASDLIKIGAVKGNSKKRGVLIDFQDISSITQMISDCPPSDWALKKSLLTCLRHLMKSSQVYALCQNETAFITKCVNYCRENKNIDFNRDAWRFLFQLCRYHPGCVDMLITTNLIGTALEFVNPTNGNVIIINGLHYLAKFFDLPAYEQRWLANGKEYVRDIETGMKTLEKDYKALLELYNKKHLYIRLHMIYKNVIDKPVGVGLDLTKLANVYRVLIFEEHCHKVYKEVKSTGEFKGELSHMKEMFTGGDAAKDEKEKESASSSDKVKETLKNVGSNVKTSVVDVKASVVSGTKEGWSSMKSSFSKLVKK
eukprot:c9605_g1_i1.p1 GENE.c9605_g1_i1~~c9605_g1_i1.p1  ORF type:complete len:665 (+),score=-30.60 c9605_g1_i1:95-1996(+)